MNGLHPSFRLIAAVLAFGAGIATSEAQIAFGDDSSQWAFDGECDDPRFVGDGMAETLVAVDRYADASDCQTLFEAGHIRLREGDTTVLGGPVDFGVDTGEWVFDGECDDPRFVGEGMAEVLVEADRLADATDCRTLFEQGRIKLRTGADAGRAARGGITAVALEPGLTEHGMLEAGDSELDAGEYCDYFTFKGAVGGMAVVMLRADDFDPYLIVRAPSGAQVDNDDYEGDATRSLVTFPMEESGTYTIGVTSYRPTETGEYSLLVEFQSTTTLPHSNVKGEIGVRAEPALPQPGFRVAAVR